MTINQRNCSGDSRMVKALIEQVSGLQEDVAFLDSQIDDLGGTKANKADIAEEVATKKLTADNATVGEGTVTKLHSSEADINKLHATETITNRLEVPTLQTLRQNVQQSQMRVQSILPQHVWLPWKRLKSRNLGKVFRPM